MRAASGFAFAALALAGCNQILGLDPPGGGNPDAVADDDGGPDDDGDVRDGDGDPDAASTAIPGRIWALDIDYIRTMVPTRGYEMSVSFGPPAETCTRVAASGSCVMDRCTATVPPATAPHSDTVTVEGNRLVAIDPDTSGRYTTRTGLDGGFFDVGVTTGAYSDGAEVPQFSLLLTAPPLVTLTSPGLPSPIAPATIPRASGLNLTWTPLVDTLIHMVITDNGGGRVQCNLLAGAGSGVVPAAVLTELVTGPGTLATYTIDSTSTVAGGYVLLYTAARSARRSDNDWARGTITLQ